MADDDRAERGPFCVRRDERGEYVDHGYGFVCAAWDTSLKVINSGLIRNLRFARVVFTEDGDSMEVYLCWRRTSLRPKGGSHTAMLDWPHPASVGMHNDNDTMMMNPT